MEALYISEAEMESIEASGNIVIGYVDETVPMYKYSSEIASMEYSKKVMSVGVWSGIAIMLVVSAITFLLSYKKV